ncbi:hypothetical protein CKF54_00585 [Psittacicella hinzii]|uniref:Viral histone-like protein n=1 Tax=Psittacicella hinzii TaxID=2028575 RepID=A0A3A1YE73_9GAMM|nr:HU family DNA-binding protein [Psittacicella hinzii]RIY34427.1 hypothetical protein CKF54_00585 [Psittacicella hinzii]
MSKELELNKTSVNELLTVKELLTLFKNNLKESGNASLVKLSDDEEFVRQLLDTWVESLKASLLAGRKVRVHNLGSFATKYRPERKFSNPLTGSVSTAPAHVNVAFTSSKTLKDLVSSNENLVKAHKDFEEKKATK